MEKHESKDTAHPGRARYLIDVCDVCLKGDLRARTGEERLAVYGLCWGEYPCVLLRQII